MSNNSFFSMDKLVEFGMGMTVAKQMTQAMNEAMTSSMQQIKGNSYSYCQITPPNNMEAAMPAKLIYTVFEGKQAGPFNESEIARLVFEKTLTKDTLVWMPGMSEWKKAEDVPEVLKIIALCPPPITNVNP